jgi:hypothetical protein
MDPTKQQLAYHHHVVRLIQIAQGVARRHNRLDAVTLDGGRMNMLSDAANHVLKIPTESATVDVVIQAHWFLDPDRYRHALEAAVESAFLDGCRSG